TREDFEGAIAIFEREMLDNMLEGPESERVMAGFKSKEYQDAADILQLYGILEQKYAEEIKANQESQTKLKLQKQIEQMKSKKEYWKNIIVEAMPILIFGVKLFINNINKDINMIKELDPLYNEIHDSLQKRLKVDPLTVELLFNNSNKKHKKPHPLYEYLEPSEN
ncbi:6474_t:CDS:2, partial [Cetraspora pellucida]